MADESVQRTYTKREYWQAIVISGILGLLIGGAGAIQFLASFTSGN